MVGDKGARLKEWLASGEASLHPATLTQRELWDVAPLPASDVSNHICTVTTIRGPVSRDTCVRAMALVVAKQEVLRISVLPGKGGQVQLVRRTGEPALEFLELEPDERGDEALDRVIVGLMRRTMDMVAGPLYRLHVLRRGEEEHLLVLVIHHAIADGWTLGVFMTDLWTAYAQLGLGIPGALEPVPQTYIRWGAAERAYWTPQEIRARAEFWRERMAGAGRLWDAPAGAGGDTGERGRRVWEMPMEAFGDLKVLAGRLGATLFSAALAVFQIVMARESGRTDIVVGSPVAGRNRRESRETMGSYAGIVPLRARVDAGLSFGGQLARTHEMTVESFANAMPFVELVAVLEEPVIPGRNPLFDTRFALQNHPMPEVSLPGVEVSYRTRSTGTARFDLACELTEIGRVMEVVWLYRKDVFEDGQVAAFHHAFAGLMAAVCQHPDAPISDLP
ncbi:hypothetical protein BH23VER1_BH23VER1_14910 [soil metagenome]